MLYYGRHIIQSGQMSTGNLVSFILYQSDLADNIRVSLHKYSIVCDSVLPNNVAQHLLKM